MQPSTFSSYFWSGRQGSKDPQKSRVLDLDRYVLKSAKSDMARTKVVAHRSKFVLTIYLLAHFPVCALPMAKRMATIPAQNILGTMKPRGLTPQPVVLSYLLHSSDSLECGSAFTTAESNGKWRGSIKPERLSPERRRQVYSGRCSFIRKAVQLSHCRNCAHPRRTHTGGYCCRAGPCQRRQGA